jgi:hypothetical protein
MALFWLPLGQWWLKVVKEEFFVKFFSRRSITLVKNPAFVIKMREALLGQVKHA